jgi:Flp pilus assembly protein TadD
MSPIRSISRSSLAAALFAAALAAASCGTKVEREAAVDPQLRSQALIDSGNASFKRDDYASAAKRYASAASVKPDDPAAYYGLGMALSKLGRDDEARVAYAKARDLAQRGGGGDSLPAGHPAVGK